MSRLLEFLRGQATDTEGRLLKEVWAWSDDEWEEGHDFVQWLFPLPEPSRFNPDAPVLNDEEIAAFHAEPLLRANLRTSFARFLSFAGLSLSADGTVVEGANFVGRASDMWAYPNHNWLRITRVLRSLRLLGLEPETRAFYDRLSALYHSNRFPIPPDTFQYWTEAAEGLPFHA